jgi:hypothetical protein
MSSRALRLLQGDGPQAGRAATTVNRSASDASSPNAFHLASSPKPSRATGSAHFKSPDDIGVNIHVALRNQDHSRWTGQVAAADARDCRSQHPIFGGPHALYSKIFLSTTRIPICTTAPADLVNRVKCLPSDEANGTEHEFNLCELEVVPKSGAQDCPRRFHRDSRIR